MVESAECLRGSATSSINVCINDNGNTQHGLNSQGSRRNSNLEQTSNNVDTLNNNGNDTQIRDDWQTVTRRKRVGLYGKRAPQTELGLRGAPRIFDVFIGNCEKTTTTEDLLKYCRELNVSINKCELLSDKSVHSRSFKISVDPDTRDAIMKEDFWPAGLYIRKFYTAKSRRAMNN